MMRLFKRLLVWIITADERAFEKAKKNPTFINKYRTHLYRKYPEKSIAEIEAYIESQL